MRRQHQALCAVLSAHVAYYAWPDGPDRRWAFYVLGGFAFAWLCLLLLPTMRSRSVEGSIGAAACVWGFLEGMQQGVCGALAWGTKTAGDLCVTLFGPWPYVIGCAAFVALYFARKHHG